MKCVFCKRETARLAYVAHREGDLRCECEGTPQPCRKVAVCEVCDKESAARKG